MTNVLTAFSGQRTFVIFYLLNSDITGGVVHNYAFSCIHRHIGCRQRKCAWNLNGAHAVVVNAEPLLPYTIDLFCIEHFNFFHQFIQHPGCQLFCSGVIANQTDEHMQQYGIAVKESRGQLSYLPAGRTKFIRAKHLGDKFDKAAVLATLQANAEHKPKVQFKQDAIGKLIDIQSRMTEGKGIGYKRWLTKHNLKVMAQTVKLLQEKNLTDEDALNQRIAELETKYHDSLAVVKDLECRMKANNELRYHIAAYTSTKTIAQQLKTAKRPAAFEEQHRAELTAYRAAAAYLKANNIAKLPSPKKLEAEYAQLASEKAKFYEQYKEAKEELLKLKTAKQNVASYFREEEQTQQER